MPFGLQPGSQPANRLALRIGRLVCFLAGTFALACHAGQTSASITVSVILTPAPVSVVSGGGTVVVCGSAPQTGDTSCGVITVPPPPVTTPPGSGGNLPGVPPPAAGGGGSVPVVPTVPVTPPVVIAPPTDTITPPQVVVPPAGGNGSQGAAPPVTLPTARATLELLTLLQSRLDPLVQRSSREPLALQSSARLESWRTQSTQVFSSASAARLSNLLGTSAEVRIVRELALNYTEMLIGW